MLDSYFRQNGLVKQQLDSYNRFTFDMEKVVNEYGKFNIPVKPQFRAGEEFSDEERWEFKFDGAVYKTSNNHKNSDKSVIKVTPMMCRLRDLNYECEVKVNLTYSKIKINNETNEEHEQWHKSVSKIQLAETPIMVRSVWCRLTEADEDERVRLGECPHDQGGYFIIRGSEKVVVGQERMAYNFIYTFKTKVES